MPITAVDSITPAIEHTKQQLFKPFRIVEWTKLAFVGLLAGELGSSGFSRSNFNIPRHTGTTQPHFPHFPNLPGSLGVDTALIIALVALGILAAFAIGIILMYVGSVMRFVLFDSIVTRECEIRAGWRRRLGPGWRYFAWRLAYILLTLAGLIIVVGAPVLYVFTSGWYKEPKEHLAALILGGIVISFVLFAFFVVTAVVLVLTKDFVVPQMALEDISVMEGWRRLWAMMQVEKGAYAVYIVMKIVLAIVAGILIGFAAVIVSLIYVIPTAAISLMALLSGKAAGLSWNAETITLAVVIGCILLAGFLYLVSLISVPAIVFFPAYSIYFFAGRYPRLQAALYPSLRVPPSELPVSP